MSAFKATAQRSRRRPKPAGSRLAVVAVAFLTACGAGSPTQSEPAAGTKPLPAAAATRAVGEPSGIWIPSIGVDSKIVPVGLKENGDMQTPEFGLAGWYDQGPKPGEKGPAVIVAHVDSKAGPDVFYKLKDLEAGKHIVVRHQGGEVAFEVKHIEQAPKEDLPVEKIWGPTDEPVLRLVTCGGTFDRSTGHYRDNVIVYATALAK